jgi:hypothetical protein
LSPKWLYPPHSLDLQRLNCPPRTATIRRFAGCLIAAIALEIASLAFGDEAATGSKPEEIVTLRRWQNA